MFNINVELENAEFNEWKLFKGFYFIVLMQKRELKQDRSNEK